MKTILLSKQKPKKRTRISSETHDFKKIGVWNQGPDFRCCRGCPDNTPEDSAQNRFLRKGEEDIFSSSTVLAESIRFSLDRRQSEPCP